MACRTLSRLIDAVGSLARGRLPTLLPRARDPIAQVVSDSQTMLRLLLTFALALNVAAIPTSGDIANPMMSAQSQDVSFARDGTCQHCHCNANKWSKETSDKIQAKDGEWQCSHKSCFQCAKCVDCKGCKTCPSGNGKVGGGDNGGGDDDGDDDDDDDGDDDGGNNGGDDNEEDGGDGGGRRK